MAGDTSSRNAASLGRVKRRLDQWRRGRRRPGQMPRELCRAAAQAAAEHGVAKTAAHLDIQPQRLAKWIDQFGFTDQQDEPAGPVGAEFIELPPLPTGPAAECHLEVEEPSGWKLRICLKGPAVAQAAVVIPAIWRERR